jgi:iron(III) transport system permease protein
LNIQEATGTGFILRKPADNKLLIFLRKSGGFWIILPMFLILIFLIVYPYFTLIYGSFTDEPPRQLSLSFQDLTLEKYRTIFTNPEFWEALGNTLIASFGGMVMALIIGVWLAWLTARTNVIGKKIIGVAAIVPLFLPSFIGALAWSFLGSPRVGILNIFFREFGLPFNINIYSIWGIIFVFGLYYTPYVYMFTSGSLNRMDPTLEDVRNFLGSCYTWPAFEIIFCPYRYLSSG